VQKCFRTVDIDEVGRTARHLTFFEMMGNFSFGDYFKDYAVECAWELSTSARVSGSTREHLGDRLRGRRAGALRRGGRAAVAAHRHPGGADRRAWDRQLLAGRADGPCGPCSELYLDRGPEHGCGRAECAPGCECDRFLEFWNLVFMQYNMLEGGALEPLPLPASTPGRASSGRRRGQRAALACSRPTCSARPSAEIERWSGARFGAIRSRPAAVHPRRHARA
jgi:alanyl-tRNA synthetase